MNNWFCDACAREGAVEHICHELNTPRQPPEQYVIKPYGGNETLNPARWCAQSLLAPMQAHRPPSLGRWQHPWETSPLPARSHIWIEKIRSLDQWTGTQQNRTQCNYLRSTLIGGACATSTHYSQRWQTKRGGRLNKYGIHDLGTTTQ